MKFGRMYKLTLYGLLCRYLLATLNLIVLEEAYLQEEGTRLCVPRT